jgi:VWFA-related protein
MLGLLSAPALLNAQAPAAPRLIDLNVVAVDSHGKPVGDLTSDDFSIVDSGKPQKIVWFRHIADQRLHAATLAPNEFSNLRSATVSGATVVLFDLLNEPQGDRGNSWYQLVHYLEALEKPETVFVYILTVDGRVYTVRGLSDQQAAPDTEPWTRQIKPMMDTAMKAVTRVRPQNIEGNIAVRVRLTYDALAKVASELSRIPGRKNIVWVTNGVPVSWHSISGDVVDFTPQLRQLGDTIQRFGVTIYPVRQSFVSAAAIGNTATLDDFARLTGGRPDDGKDIGAAITQAMSDLRSSYEIGYYPAPPNWDGKFHKLEWLLRLGGKTGCHRPTGHGFGGGRRT